MAREGRTVGSLKRRVRSHVDRGAAVAGSTFPSQNAQKNEGDGRLLEVGSLKNGTPLWRKAHFQVKMFKKPTAPDHFWKLEV